MARKSRKGINYTKGGYYKVTDGEWITVHWKGNKDQCCDCGLIHRVNYRINEDSGRLEVQVFRDYRATNGARKHFQFEKDED